MFELPFHGDGVEPLPNIFHPPDDLNLVLSSDFRLDDRLCREDPHPRLPKNLEERAVFKLARDAGTDPL